MCTRTVVGLKRIKQYSHIYIYINIYIYEEALPAPIIPRSFRATTICGQGGNARNLLDLRINPQQAKVLVVPAAKRSNAFWQELGHQVHALIVPGRNDQNHLGFQAKQKRPAWYLISLRHCPKHLEDCYTIFW